MFGIDMPDFAKQDSFEVARYAKGNVNNVDAPPVKTFSSAVKQCQCIRRTPGSITTLLSLGRVQSEQLLHRFNRYQDALQLVSRGNHPYHLVLVVENGATGISSCQADFGNQDQQ